MQKRLRFILPLLYLIALFPQVQSHWYKSYVVFFIFLMLLIIYSLKILFNSKYFKCCSFDILIISIIALMKFINVIYIHSYLLGLIIFIGGLCSVVGMFAEDISKVRLYWLSFLTILVLPISEYVRIFVGTPLRFFSASFVEKFLSIFGYGELAQSTIINFGNSFTNVDYPCSGNNTILVILIFTAVLGCIFRIKFSAKLVFVMLLSVVSFVFLNIIRILTLIFLFSLKLFSQSFVSGIHLGLGLFNFFIIFVLIYYLFSRSNYKQDTNKICNTQGYSYWYFLVVALLLLCFNFLNIKNPSSPGNSTLNAHQGTSFTEAEIKFFNQHSAKVEKVKMDNNVMKLTVKTCSWTAHHNPENCIKGSGRKILISKVVPVGKYFIRSVETDKGFVYYYYTDKVKIVDDYYKRVYYSMFTKSKCWTLVEYSSKYPLDEKYILSDLLK